MEYDVNAMWNLANAVVIAAYSDYCNMLAMEYAFLDQPYSKVTKQYRKTVEQIAASNWKMAMKQSERHRRHNAEKGLTLRYDTTPPRLSDYVMYERSAAAKNGANALRFMESDRFMIFTHGVSGDVLLRTARKQVKRWADGEIASFAPSKNWMIKKGANE